MSQTTSATTGRRYGLERVCRLWEQSRSAFYARRARLQRSASADSPCRRGPTPALSDAQLLAAIRNDLARSPFQGEGHRKVHARLRILDGVRVSRTRVLRVMRAQGLLSPHRGRQGEPKPHDGTIVTSAPDVMWGTDGARVLTVDDGWVWTFAAIDHWNAECVGWHVCKVGDRFAALEPVAQGLRRRCGSVEADALHRAAPTPKVSSWISTPGDGRRLRFGVVCVVTLRQQPQATGDQAWDECSSRGDDRRSDAGPRRSRCSRCRGQACGRRARRPTDGGGTAPQVPAQVRVGDDTRFTASGPIRLAVHRSQPVLPSAASTRAWSAVARKSASYRVQIAVTAGRAAGTGTDSRLPRWRFTNDRRPRLLTLSSIVRPPLSRFTVFSLFPPFWSCPAVRRPVPQ